MTDGSCTLYKFYINHLTTIMDKNKINRVKESSKLEGYSTTAANENHLDDKNALKGSKQSSDDTRTACNPLQNVTAGKKSPFKSAAEKWAEWLSSQESDKCKEVEGSYNDAWPPNDLRSFRLESSSEEDEGLKNDITQFTKSEKSFPEITREKNLSESHKSFRYQDRCLQSGRQTMASPIDTVITVADIEKYNDISLIKDLEYDGSEQVKAMISEHKDEPNEQIFDLERHETQRNEKKDANKSGIFDLVLKKYGHFIPYFTKVKKDIFGSINYMEGSRGYSQNVEGKEKLKKSNESNAITKDIQPSKKDSYCTQFNNDEFLTMRDEIDSNMRNTSDYLENKHPNIMEKEIYSRQSKYGGNSPQAFEKDLKERVETKDSNVHSNKKKCRSIEFALKILKEQRDLILSIASDDSVQHKKTLVSKKFLHETNDLIREVEKALNKKIEKDRYNSTGNIQTVKTSLQNFTVGQEDVILYRSIDNIQTKKISSEEDIKVKEDKKYKNTVEIKPRLHSREYNVVDRDEFWKIVDEIAEFFRHYKFLQEFILIKWSESLKSLQVKRRSLEERQNILPKETERNAGNANGCEASDLLKEQDEDGIDRNTTTATKLEDEPKKVIRDFKRDERQKIANKRTKYNESAVEFVKMLLVGSKDKISTGDIQKTEKTSHNTILDNTHEDNLKSVHQIDKILEKPKGISKAKHMIKSGYTSHIDYNVARQSQLNVIKDQKWKLDSDGFNNYNGDHHCGKEALKVIHKAKDWMETFIPELKHLININENILNENAEIMRKDEIRHDSNQLLALQNSNLNKKKKKKKKRKLKSEIKCLKEQRDLHSSEKEPSRTITKTESQNDTRNETGLKNEATGNSAELNDESNERIIKLDKEEKIHFKIEDNGDSHILWGHFYHFYSLEKKQNIKFHSEDKKIQVSFVGNQIFVSTQNSYFDISFVRTTS